MAKFIELTDVYSGHVTRVNMDAAAWYGRFADTSRTEIIFTQNSRLIVEESPEVVDNLIKEVQA